MDLKKEIKISDLFRKRDKKPAVADAEDKPKRSSKRKQKKDAEPRARKSRERRPSHHKRLVGLKIGASQLAAARVVNNGSPELVQLAREGLDPGIIVGGELREPDALTEALKRFFRANKLPKQNVRLGIASNRIGVRTFEIGGIDDPKQLENAIRFRAQETLENIDPERAAKVRTAVHEELQTFARELVSSLQFYQGQPGSLGIGEIVLTGGTAHLPGLDTELARLIGARVRVGDPLAHVKLGKKVTEDGQLGSLAVAIGLGIETD